jgi:hypothetical protein
MQEIYGMDTHAPDECVVCMTEARDVMVLPCRHMCLCRGCADTLRQQSHKCPICRGSASASTCLPLSRVC